MKKNELTYIDHLWACMAHFGDHDRNDIIMDIPCESCTYRLQGKCGCPIKPLPLREDK